MSGNVSETCAGAVGHRFDIETAYLYAAAKRQHGSRRSRCTRIFHSGTQGQCSHRNFRTAKKHGRRVDFQTGTKHRRRQSSERISVAIRRRKRQAKTRNIDHFGRVVRQIVEPAALHLALSIKIMEADR